MSQRGVPANLTAMRNKYGTAPKAERTYNGRLYASKREAAYAAQLDLLVKLGQVLAWNPQIRIPLCGKSGTRVAWYIADFEVIVKGCCGPATEYHEIKGMETETWRLKHRWLKADYPDLMIRVLTKSRRGFPEVIAPPPARGPLPDT